MEETEEIEKNKKTNFLLIAIISILVILLGIEIFFIFTDVKAIKDEDQNLDDKIIQTSTSLEDSIKENQNIEENNITEETAIEEKIDEDKTEIKKDNTANNTKYKLEINCQANVINVYKKDSKGNYTDCIKTMVCSTGYATPQSGTYYLKKYSGWEWKGLFGDVYGQYTTQVEGNILIHSVPYLKKYDKSSLEYWEYNKLGTAASMGCIRLTVADAHWIFYNCEIGTPITFYRSSNPGPLGKPSTVKISSEAEAKGWDPTDPDQNNPWNKSNQDSESIKPTETEKTEENNNIMEDLNNNAVEDNNIANEVEDKTTENEVDENEIENETIENEVDENETNSITVNNIENNNLEQNV